MRQWPLLGLEHVAFKDLPVLPFLAPRLLKPWPFRVTLSSSRRIASPEFEQHPNKSEPNARHLSDVKALKQTNTGNSCPFSAARTSVAKQRRCHLHSSTRNNHDARQIDAFPQKASFSTSKETEVVDRGKKHRPRWPNYPNIRGRSGLGRLWLDNPGEISQNRIEASSGQKLDRSGRSRLRKLANSGGVDGTITFPEKRSLKPAQRHKNSDLRRIRLLEELSSRHPLRASHKSLKQETSPSKPSSGTTDSQTSTMGTFSRTWTETIANVNAYYDPAFRTDLREKYTPHLLPNVSQGKADPEIAKAFLKKYTSITEPNYTSVKRHWDGLLPSQRSDIWPFIILEYLSKAPRSALEFVHATKLKPVPPCYQLVDLLDINAMHLLYNPDADHYASLFKALELAMQTYPTTLSISQRTIWVLLKYRNMLPIDAKSLREMMEPPKAELAHSTHLQFAFALATEQEHALASTSFFEAVRVGADVKSSQVKLTAANLLRELPSKDGYGVATKLVADFLSIDMELTVAMYNVLMLKAFDSGDPATGWSIYDLVKSHGMKADDYTYCVILRASRTTNDALRCEEVLMEIESLANHRPSDTLLAEMLRNLYFFRNKMLSYEAKFNQVINFYARYYDMKLLIRLGVVNRATQYDFVTKHNRMPTSSVIGIILFAFIRTAGVGDCIRVYKNFREVVEESQDPPLIILAAYPFVYDIFLKRICDMKSPLWQRVLADMSAELPDTINPETGEQFVPPKPTTQTMNIILHGYAKKGDSEAVKQLLHLMGELKLKPNVVTYTSIVDAHARKQDVRLVAESLKHMEDQAVAANSFTLWSINRINDRAGLVKALREIQHERQAVDQPLAEPDYAHVDNSAS